MSDITEKAEVETVRAARRPWLSPLNRRRWQNFKANKRGYWSLWIFLVLFVLSLFAEFLANDKPILAMYKGELLVPALVDYPEEKFGGFYAVTDYRDPVIADAFDTLDRHIDDALGAWLSRPREQGGYGVPAEQLPARVMMLRSLLDGLNMRQARHPRIDLELLRAGLEGVLPPLQGRTA